MRTTISFCSAVAMLVWAVSCGPATPSRLGAGPKPTVPMGTPSPDQPAADPFAIPTALGREQLPAAVPSFARQQLKLGPLPNGVPPAPAACQAFTQRAPAKALTCSDRSTTLAALAQALAEGEASRRDALLVDVEGCAGLRIGIVRALRAELAPVECGDALVETLLAQPPAALDGVTHDALFGLALAGRLARTVLSPPQLDPPHDKQRVADFHKGPLATWGLEQATAIQQLARLGVKLAFYGKAVAAVEAGMADMRFIEAVRAMPIPDEYTADAELRHQYYANLERGLDARKRRGRDAALVGLQALAFVGVIRDPRVKRARDLLARVYGGRPIDALDALRLPPVAAPQPTTDTERLAALLPSFYAGVLLEANQATTPAVFRQLVQRGVPLSARIALRGAELTAEVRSMYARARLELGRTYWRRVDFDEATELLADWPGERPADATLLLALALALRGGPADAAEMIRTAPLARLPLGPVAALDALAAASPPGELTGLAALDGAVILQVAAPMDAAPVYWTDLASRYRRAAALLRPADVRRAALERATDAEATAREIQGRR